PPRVVGITARLDKHEAKPGEVVRLTEVVPAGKDVRVAGQGHSVYYTAYYDRKLGQFVALEPEQYSFRFPEIFHGLPGATILGWNEFTVTNPREKGYEFEIQAKYLGVFLIEANWLTKDGRIYSQPVILTISPPLGEDGKPIVKPEWLQPPWNR